MSTVTGYTTKERWSVGISAALGYALDYYNLIILAFLIPAMQKSLHISLTQVGAITSITLAGSVVGGVLFGYIGDGLGRKKSLLYTLGLFSVGAALSAFAWDFTSLLWFRFIAGIGLGGEWGAGMVLFNEVWDRRRRGLGSSIIQACIAFGIAAASVVGVWAVAAYGPDLGWRIALFTGASPVLLMIYVRFAMPESRLWTEYDRLRKTGELPPQKAAERSALVEIFRGASLRYLILGIIAWGAYVIAYQSVTVFMPVLMTKTLGATPGVVRSATLVYSAFLSAWMLVLGWYSDRGGRRSGVFMTTLVSIVGFVGLYMTASGHYPGSLWAWPLFWWYLVWAIGQTAAAMYGPWLSEQYPVELRSTAVATVYTLGRGVGALAPVVVPLIAAAFHGDLRTGMMFGLLGNLITLVAIRFLPETAGRQFNVIEDKQVEETRPAVLAEQVATP